MKITFPILALMAAAGWLGFPLEMAAEKTSPKPLDIVQPEYPAELKARLVEGEAVVTMTISEEGLPVDCVLKSATHEAFGEAAMEAVRQWRFEPARQDGKAVATRVNLPLRFTMTAEERINAAFKRQVFKRIDPDVAVLEGKSLPDGRQPVLNVPTFPRYPEKLKGTGAEGEVTVRFVIDVDGRPINPEFTGDADPAFYAPVLAAVARAEYEPYIHEGEPAYVLMELNYLIREQPEQPRGETDGSG